MHYLAHAHLGRNWGISLEIRVAHQLINGGVYRFARHPMYLAFFLQGKLNKKEHQSDKTFVKLT
jgi:protein-S-isoprenylcysteine O-methyltransferase Ste14